MSEAIAKAPPTSDAEGALQHALKSVVSLTEQSGEQLQHGLVAASGALIHAASELLEEAKSQSAALAKGARKEVKEHPVSSAASVILASAAVIGLMNAMHHRHASQEDDQAAAGGAKG